MKDSDEVIYCTNCGVEIAWLPEIIAGKPYCCLDCYHYRACACAGVFELEEERQTAKQAASVPTSDYPD